MDDESLLELNNHGFRELFYRRIAEKDSKLISKKQFFKFACNLKILPDLLSTSDLKKLFRIILRTEQGEKLTDISYSKFKKLLKAIAQFCFPSGDSLKFLITHIKTMCHLHYQTNLINKVSKELTLTRNQRFFVTNREKFNQKVALNKSSSQKLYLSGLASPKNKTQMVKKNALYLSPSTQMINSRKSHEYLQNLSSVLMKFKAKFHKICEKSKKKPAFALGLCLRNLELNSKDVKTI